MAESYEASEINGDIRERCIKKGIKEKSKVIYNEVRGDLKA